MKKTTPIIFSTEMIKAILDLRKSQTRRLNNLKSVNYRPDVWKLKHLGIMDYLDDSKYRGKFGAYFENKHLVVINGCPIVCPYGQPGDQLWVKENWGLYDTEPKDGPEKAFVFYKASDGDNYELRYQLWRPSIFMPRWASRILLDITDIRLERLQDITPQDVIKEGFIKSDLPGDCDGHSVHSADRVFIHYFHASTAYQKLWDSLNANRGYPWNNNNWVWVIEFMIKEIKNGKV